MPNITVSSTTDSPDAVLAATGAGLPQEKKVVEPPPSEQAAKASETPEASDATDETDESKSSDDSEESNDEEKETEPKPKKRGGFKKRIDKLNTRLSAKEQEVEYWKQEALKNKRVDDPVDKSKAKDADSKPKSEDFESHEAYIEAVTDWKVEKKLSENDRKTEEQALKAEMKSQEDQYRDKLVEFKKDHEDFDELMEDIDDIPMSFTVRNVLLDSDNGPELAYALAKNRDEYERICKLPAIAAARELGRFEARLNQESSKEQKKINKTNAPPPVKTVGSKGSGASKKSPDQMDYDEYKKWRASGMSS